MKSATISQEQFTATGAGRLYVGIELSAREWRLAYTTSVAAPIMQLTVPAGQQERLRSALTLMKARCGLAADAPVVSCYEAGRDGFWPHRVLTALGVVNHVVDSSSIEVNRRARRAKTDRLDASKLVRQLLRVALGERGVWHVVHVPPAAVEAARHAPRTLAMLVKERTRWRNRIHALLATVGLRIALRDGWETRLEALRQWDGRELPETLRTRLTVAARVLATVDAELKACRRAQVVATRAATTAAAQTARRLVALRGIGERFAWVMATEVCAREMANRRQVGALTGFVTMPYQSGEHAHDQGISRAGLASLRGLAVEAAWTWLRWQPDSELTQWFQRRFATGGPRARQIGIVAVARKLVIALWRYSRDGVVPTGAITNRAVA